MMRKDGCGADAHNDTTSDFPYAQWCGRKFKERREALGWTLAHTCERMMALYGPRRAIKPPQLSEIENGKSFLRADTMIMIMHTLGELRLAELIDEWLRRGGLRPATALVLSGLRLPSSALWEQARATRARSRELQARLQTFVDDEVAIAD